MANAAESKYGAVVILMVVMGVVVVGALDDAPWSPRGACQQMRGECRLKTYETDDGLVFRNASCYCKYNKDVSYNLEALSSANCMNALGELVNFSILHIVGCNVSSKAPLQSLLATFRSTSDHLELYVEHSSWLSLASPSLISRLSEAKAPSTINATFLNSNISGIPGDVVGGASLSANVIVEGGEVGVLESRAFSGYSPGAQVTLSFRNTTILTVKQGAFDLPREAQVEVRGGWVYRFERYCYAGGASLTLDGIRGANMLQSAISIYGLKKLTITNCTMAQVYYNALGNRPPTYARNITWNSVKETSEAIFSDNKFMGGNGQAFAQLCNVAKIAWINNILLTTSDMPLRLQAPECGTKRDWPLVFSSNGISCENCSNFINPDSQTCALFASSYCVSCEKALDNCNEPVLPYITSKCKASHPDVSKALTDTCGVTARKRTPKALQDSKSGASVALLTPLALGAALYVPALLRVRV